MFHPPPQPKSHQHRAPQHPTATFKTSQTTGILPVGRSAAPTTDLVWALTCVVHVELCLVSLRQWVEITAAPHTPWEPVNTFCMREMYSSINNLHAVMTVSLVHSFFTSACTGAFLWFSAHNTTCIFQPFAQISHGQLNRLVWGHVCIFSVFLGGNASCCCLFFYECCEKFMLARCFSSI